jgi:hypothetical protein
MATRAPQTGNERQKAHAARTPQNHARESQNRYTERICDSIRLLKSRAQSEHPQSPRALNDYTPHVNDRPESAEATVTGI